MSPLMSPGQEPLNKGRKYPAEVLTADVDLKKHSVRVLHGKGNKATTRAASLIAATAPSTCGNSHQDHPIAGFRRILAAPFSNMQQSLGPGADA